MYRFATLFTMAIAMCILVSTPVFAGLNAAPLGYNVSQGTYTAITNGTVLETGNDMDGFSQTVTLPFTFYWNGVAYTDITVYGDGFIEFVDGGGGSLPGNLPGNGNAVSAWYNDLTGTTGGEIRTATLGTSPERTFVVQWKNATRAPQGSTEDSYNFQIRLDEATGLANIVYGSMTITGAVGAQIGASSSNVGEIAFTVSYWLNDWMHPYIGMATECMALENWGPASGTTYTVGTATSADARVSKVTSPAGKFNANTTQTVKVKVVNAGSNPIDSVQITWAVNGTTRSTMRYYANPRLQPGDEVEVTLGNVTFTAGTFNTITAWTSSPNGVIDQYPGNDVMQFYMAPRVSGRLYLATTGNAGVFANFKNLMRHLVTAGISGNTNVHVYNGNYTEQILVPKIDNALNGGIVTLQNAANNSPSIGWDPLNSPNGYYSSYEYDYAQLTVLEGASVAVDGLRFRLPNGLNWGGNLLCAGTSQVQIKNCTFVGPDNYKTMTNPMYSVTMYGGPFTFSNNNIDNMQTGLYVNGSSSSADVVSNNTITNFTETGAQISSLNVDVDGNTIVSAANATDYAYGLGVSGAGWLRNNEVTINIPNQTQSYGIGVECVSSNGYPNGPHGLLIYNNMVSVAASGTSLGLVCQPDAGNVTTKLYNNSVLITGGAPAENSVALYVPGDAPIDIVNNVLENRGTGANGGYAVYVDNVNPANVLQTVDFNDLMTSGPNVGYFMADIVRNAVGNPLTAWRTATGKDANSVSVSASFVSNSNLHLNSIQNALFGSAVTLATVNTDIDGDQRYKPYMGADEVRPNVKVLESPQSRYACLGESFQLICVANTTQGAITTYQWYKDGVKLQGSTGSILVMHSVGYPASGSYTCVVTCSDGTSSVSDTSEAATIIVVRNTSIVKQPVSQPVGMGSTVTLEVEAEAIGAPTEFQPQYQWKKHYWSVQNQAYLDTNVVDNNHVTGSKSNRLTIAGVTSADTMDTYVCVVIGYCGTVTSKQARLYMPLIAASTSTPVACDGGSVNVEVIVIPESIPGSTVEFQWYHGANALQNSARITGSNTKALRITGATSADAGEYHCVIVYNGADVTVESNSVTVVMGTPPAIATQPSADTVCAGSPMAITVDANGGGLRYQWYKGTTAIPGAVASQYSVGAASEADAGAYSVTVTNPCGTVTSEVVEVVVNTKPVIVTQPTDVAINTGDTLRMWVEATGTAPVSYQWYRDTTMIIGATDSVYVVDSARAEDQGLYSCTVTNACGTDSSITAFANVTVVGVAEDVVLTGYSLGSASPNPTTDGAQFMFALPTAQMVRVVLLNTVGSVVAELYNGFASNGAHTVRVQASAMNLPAGVYTYTIQAGAFVASKRVVVVR